MYGTNDTSYDKVGENNTDINCFLCISAIPTIAIVIVVALSRS